ncbi:serine carboxypeptidase-like 16 [Rutidosis leptorrhynchoides]|uniref:serine carboxypeptidase-like 16 n=1 Tax=Rutidosis leptorrhynchoides TaxID=125765 RepID=UPI003A991EA6
MESRYISLQLSIFIFFVCFTQFSNSKSIVKKLPGFRGDLPFTFETGYVGVGENEDVQFFYYFIESQRNPSQDPLLLYLTGGPGTSGLFPLLYQIGPLSFHVDNSLKKNVTLQLNPYSWTKEANVIFLDLPAGVGFSYAKTFEASQSSDSLLAIQSYEFLRKWFVEHPRFLKNPLYISGISYMGILVPVVTFEVYKGNEQGNQPQLNIKGCLIVSPLTDKFIDFNSRVEFSHRVALISDEIYESIKATCDGNYVYVNPSNTLCSDNLKRMDDCLSDINFSDVLEPVCDDLNPAPDCSAATKVVLDAWANDKDVQKALHVREGTIGLWEKTNETIHWTLGKNDSLAYSYDVFSVVSYHQELVNRKSEVLIISGDHDLTFPYVGTEKWIKSLNLSVVSPWSPWFVDTQVAGYKTGYKKNEYSLTYVTIKGAGHAVALNKPKEAFAMVNGWLDSRIYLSDS